MRRVLSFFILTFTCAAASFAQDTVPRTILVFGDSLTAGYGLEDPATESFPGRLQQMLDARSATATGDKPAHPWRVINAGVSGGTSAGGVRRIDWMLRQPVDVLVLALGANDGLRGLPLEEIRSNLVAIAAKVRTKNPGVRVLLAGMKMPPNLGEYSHAYDRLFPALATAEHWSLVPFLLEGVGGVPELNQPDGIHPTAAGHMVIAKNVLVHLLPIL